jgi:hypothetical protein
MRLGDPIFDNDASIDEPRSVYERHRNMNIDNDKFNIGVADSQHASIKSKRILRQIQLPLPPMTFPLVADPQCGTVFLNQELGDGTHKRIPRGAGSVTYED